MAVKAKAKAKKRNETDALEEKFRERYEYALEIKEQQDEQTIVAINRLVAQMQRMAPQRQTEQENRIQLYSFTWIAVRLLIACGEWGIRIANFKAPKKQCVRCGKKVKG